MRKVEDATNLRVFVPNDTLDQNLGERERPFTQVMSQFVDKNKRYI